MLFAVPVVPLTPVAGFLLHADPVTRPDGAWDKAAYGAIELGCVLAILSAGAAGAPRPAPSARGGMRWPWSSHALSLGRAAAVRWVSSGA